MSIEKKILEAAFNDRHAAETIQQLVSEDTLSDYARNILRVVHNFYTHDGDTDNIDVELFCDILEQEYPKNHGELQDVVRSLGSTSPQNVIQQIQKLRKQELGRELAQELVQKPDSARTQELWSELNDPLLSEQEEISTAAEMVEDSLIDTLDDGKRIVLYPTSLDTRLEQGARHGNHVVVFARPNVGKTAFIINLIRGLLRDGRGVLYVCNEEPSAQVLKRIVSRITGRDTASLRANVQSAVQESEELLSRLYIKDLSPGTFKDIHGLTKRTKPDIVIIDQLRNIKSSEENRVLQLDQMAREARELGKVHNVLVISVTQAGDSARNKLVLDDGDIDFSNTGIPGAADLIIGIGMNDEYRTRGRRMITIVKNKLGSNHESFPVSIDEPLAKILSL